MGRGSKDRRTRHEILSEEYPRRLLFYSFLCCLVVNSVHGYNATTAAALGPLVSASSVGRYVGASSRGCCTTSPVYLVMFIFGLVLTTVLAGAILAAPEKGDPISAGVLEMCDYLDKVKGDFGHVYLDLIPLDFEYELRHRYPAFVLRLRDHGTGYLYLWYRREALVRASTFGDEG